MQKKNATQKDVAKLAGVSQAAVSRFISGNGSISDDVRERIVSAIALVNYQPDPIGRGLSNGQFDIVAIVMANITNPWYPVVLEKITRELHERGLQVMLFNAEPPRTVDDLMPLVLQYRVRGVIITTATLASQGAELCAKRNVPVVLFNRYSRVGAGHSVSCDNVDAGRKVADLLIASGSEKMAFIGGFPEVSTNQDRRRGFLERLAEKGISPTAVVEKEYTYQWGFAATEALLKQHPDVSGLFCADDEIASGAIDALRHSLGKRVPEDVRVCGFDDHPVASLAAYQISTIRQPVETMITTALDLLLGAETSFQSKVFPGEFIQRNSLPPLPASAPQNAAARKAKAR
jgi:DNA-binding LacI/PurR family transcriptional regulator